jgi:hypothetical protein
MFHLTIFAGSETTLAPSGCSALTVFGGAELRAPTIAQRIMDLKARRERRISAWERLTGAGRNLAITVFGYTGITLPTLTEEYDALRALVHSGAIGRQECEQLLRDLQVTPQARTATLTWFGGFCESRPTPKVELKALESASRAGRLDPRTRGAIESLIGSAEPSIVDGLGRLALT